MAQQYSWWSHTACSTSETQQRKLLSKRREKCQEMDDKTIEWTLFYNNYCLMSASLHQLEEMAGLCNICTESGAENFENVNKLAERIELHWLLCCKTMRVSMPNF